MNDAISLGLALAGAVVYGTAIVILVVKNRQSWTAKGIAVVAVLIWPNLLMMPITQLLFSIPVFAVFATHGTDISKPLSASTVALAIGSVVAIFTVLFVVTYYITLQQAQ